MGAASLSMKVRVVSCAALVTVLEELRSYSMRTGKSLGVIGFSLCKGSGWRDETQEVDKTRCRGVQQTAAVRRTGWLEGPLVRFCPSGRKRAHLTFTCG